MRFYWIYCVALVYTTVVLGCAGGPTSPDSGAAIDEAELQELWNEGQGYLAQLGERWAAEGGAPISGDVFSIGTSRFHFVAHEEPLSLRGEPVGGYFDSATQTVHYYRPLMAGAIPHEVGHAVLYALADPRWRCAFHENCR